MHLICMQMIQKQLKQIYIYIFFIDLLIYLLIIRVTVGPYFNESLNKQCHVHELNHHKGALSWDCYECSIRLHPYLCANLLLECSLKCY